LLVEAAAAAAGEGDGLTEGDALADGEAAALADGATAAEGLGAGLAGADVAGGAAGAAVGLAGAAELQLTSRRQITSSAPPCRNRFIAPPFSHAHRPHVTGAAARAAADSLTGVPLRAARRASG